MYFHAPNWLRLLVVPGNLAAFAAPAAARGHGCDFSVPGFKRPSPQRQEVPRAQTWRKSLWKARLQKVDSEDRDDEKHYRDEDGEESGQAGERQTEHQERDEEEAEQDVEHCEPAILGSHITQRLCHDDGDAHERQDVPQDDARDIEEQMDQSDLKE